MADNWTDKLRTEMEDFQSMDIPEGLWEGIEQGLDARRAVSPWRRNIAAAVAAIIVCGSAVVWFMQHTSDKEMVIAHHAEQLSKSGNLQTNHSDGNDVPAIGSESHRSMVSASRPQAYNRDEGLPEQSTEPLAETAEEKQEEPKHIAKRDGNASEDAKPVTTNPTTHPGYTSASEFTPQRKTSSLSRFSARIFTAMSAQDNTSARQGYMALSASGMPDNERQMFSKSPFGKLDDLYLANALDTDEKVKSETKHSQPVRLGISMGYDIDSRLALTAGVTYTKLHSILTSGTSTSYFTNSQDIHYLGIPVNVHYDVLRTPHLRLYGAAGGMVEFGVKGDVEVMNVTKGKVVSVERNEITNIPVQYSVNAAVGAEYVILHGIGIYAEPGVSYYFKNHSDLSTIYSAHPLNFSLQLGLRWNIARK